MPESEAAAKKRMQALRARALRHPGTEAGIACEGTALERRTVKVNKKAFVFIGLGDLMLKLDRSLAAAVKLAAKEPARFKAGSGGWVKVTFGVGGGPSLEILGAWIDESFAIFSGSARTSAKAKGAPAKRTTKRDAKGARRTTKRA